jgi:hypothetical protein
METRQCAICGKDITRYPKQFKSKNVFCSRKHKEKGMSLGLVAPMRLGTGYGVADILRRRKYYKYRGFDDRNNYQRMDMGVREFCKKLANARCYYCDGTDDIGLDRVDNLNGHHESNVVICCHLCNMTRGRRFTVEQMKKLGAIIKTFR